MNDITLRLVSLFGLTYPKSTWDVQWGHFSVWSDRLQEWDVYVTSKSEGNINPCVVTGLLELQVDMTL